MTRNPPHRRRGQLLGAGITVALAVAGCGSSQNTSTAGASASNSAPSGATGRAGGPHFSATVVACLKKHGVTVGAGGFGHRGQGPGGPGGGPPSGATGGTGPGGSAGTGGAPPAGATGATGRRFRRPAGGFRGGAQSSKFRTAMKACGVNFGGPPAAGSQPGTSSS
jgi:hypothetical protein